MTKKREVVVITGASAGVGRATAKWFAQRGAHVGLLGRGTDGLEGAVKDVEAAGGKALALAVDVADPEQVENAAMQIENEFGEIDFWINNAMTSVFAEFNQITPVEYKRVTEVTYLGVVYGTMSALKRMQPRNRGTIVQVGSALAYRGIPLQSAYCGAKHAIQGFTESVRCELIHNKSRVHITMVQMPALNTPQFDWVLSRLPNQPQPVPPIFQPEVAAEAIYWAAHHRRREIYVGFSSVKAIIGNRIVPGFADRYLAKKGFDSQQTDKPVSGDRKANLWQPVAGDHGAHGSFDKRSRTKSWQLWCTTHRSALTLGISSIAILMVVFVVLL